MQLAGSPYTPGAAAAAAAGGFSSPRGNLGPTLAAQTPGQLAASLRAQNKSFDDVVLELADMVGWVLLPVHSVAAAQLWHQQRQARCPG